MKSFCLHFFRLDLGFGDGVGTLGKKRQLSSAMVATSECMGWEVKLMNATTFVIFICFRIFSFYIYTYMIYIYIYIYMGTG